MRDFAVRRLPPSFVKPWDEWLSDELSAARSILADDWAANYRQAPMLCFSLAAGAVDDRIWRGLLVPSFDRVGREFPLTLAKSWPQHPAVTVQRQWWAALAASARRALEPGCGADGVEKALEMATAGAEMAPAGAPPGAIDILSGPGDGKTAWWPWCCNDSSEAVPTVFSGLPRGAGFRTLLCAR